MFLVSNMELTGQEKFQIQYLLPVQGSLSTLEQVENILNKLNIKAEDATSEAIETVDLTGKEIQFLIEMIEILDKAQKLSLPSMSLIRKILKFKE